MTSKLLPFLALVLSLVIFFLYINPTWTGTIVSAKQSIMSDDLALKAAAAYTAQENTLATAKSQISPENTERLEMFLPDSVDNVGLILDLNALAARNGLTLSNIDVAKVSASKDAQTAVPSGPSALGSVNLSLTAIGTFSALNQFLKSVELSERLLDVRDLTVTGSDTGVYTYKMTIRLYWLR